MTRFFNFKLDSASPAPGPFDIAFQCFPGDTGYFLNTGTNTPLTGVTKTAFLAGITGKITGGSGDYLQLINVTNDQPDCLNTISYYAPFLAILIDASGGIFNNPPDSAHNFNFYLSGVGAPIATIANWNGDPTLIVGLTGIADGISSQPTFPNSPTVVSFSSQYVNHTGNAAGYNANKLYFTSASTPPLTGFRVSIYSAIIQGVYGSQVVDFQSTLVNSAAAGPYSGLATSPAFNFS